MASVFKMIEQTSIKHDRLIKKLTAPLFQHFGIHYFCYQFVSHEGDWFTYGNNPDWLVYSAEHHFFKSDPSLIKPHHYHVSSVCFPQHHQNELFQRTLITDARELFDLDHTLAVIEPNNFGCEYYFFATSKHHIKIFDIYLTQINLLRRDYIRYMQTYLQPIYKNFLENTVNLKEINPYGFNSKTNILMAEDHIEKKHSFLSAIKTIPALTQREYECLYYYQQGLTAKQTALKMGISHRTIEDYFENIKEKYGVNTKRDLLTESVVNTVINTDRLHQ